MRGLTNLRPIAMFCIAATAVVVSACGATTASAIPPIASAAAPAPLCNPSGPPPTQFCLTQAEKAANETVLHDPTIPDGVMLRIGFNLTTSPAATSSVTQQQAIQTAEAECGGIPGEQVNSAILAEQHTGTGYPTAGGLTWIVDLSPPTPYLDPIQGGGPARPGTPSATNAPVYEKYVIALVNPTTGKPAGCYYAS